MQNRLRISQRDAMFRSFNLELNDELKEYYKKELSPKKYRGGISSFMDENGDIIAKDLIEEWFPNEHFDIFLSHSHADEEKAFALSNYLEREFGLFCFVDSAVWGYANDILREIDNGFCLNYDGKTYNYEKRNISTAHIHNMLSVALSAMMDKCECLIFLNTDNSLIRKDNILNDNSDNTHSSWLYYELTMRKMLRVNPPTRNGQLGLSTENLNEEFYKSLHSSIKYDVDLTDMKKISYTDLCIWKSYASINNRKGPKALDELYNMKL